MDRRHDSRILRPAEERLTTTYRTGRQSMAAARRTPRATL